MLPEPREGQTPPGEGRCTREIPAQDLLRAKSQERTIRFVSLKNVPDPGKQAVLQPGAWRSRTQDTHRVLLLLLVKTRDTGQHANLPSCKWLCRPVPARVPPPRPPPHTHTGQLPGNQSGKTGSLNEISMLINTFWSWPSPGRSPEACLTERHPFAPIITVISGMSPSQS